MDIITEIVSFSIQDGISGDEFVKIVDRLECEFHSKQPGFINTELLYDSKNNCWIMIQHWRSMDELKAASKNMFSESVTETFRAVLNTKSISIHSYPQIQVWK